MTFGCLNEFIGSEKIGEDLPLLCNLTNRKVLSHYRAVLIEHRSEQGVKVGPIGPALDATTAIIRTIFIENGLTRVPIKWLAVQREFMR